jgi:hypothetical protein
MVRIPPACCFVMRVAGFSIMSPIPLRICRVVATLGFFWYHVRQASIFFCISGEPPPHPPWADAMTDAESAAAATIHLTIECCFIVYSSLRSVLD